MILGLTTARETYRPGQRVGSRLTDRHAPSERPESGMPTGPAGGIPYSRTGETG